MSTTLIMEFIAKNASRLANAAVNSMTVIMNSITASASSSAQEKLTTMVYAFRTPKAQLFTNMILIFLAGGVVFYPNMNSMPVLIPSTSSADGGHETDHESDEIVASSNLTHLTEYFKKSLLSPIRVFTSWIERSTLMGIHQISFWSCIIFTANICFDVFFYYNIERINDRGSNSNNRSITRSGGSEPIKKGDGFCVKIVELILNELKTEEAKN